jgi:methionine-rich copper-binding protein CopC
MPRVTPTVPRAKRLARARSLSAVATLALAAAAGAQTAVVSTAPAMNASNVPRAATISLTFDRPMDPATFTYANFKVFGKVTGPIVPGQAGVPALAFSNRDQTVTLTPARPLAAGETVMVVVSRNVRGADGVAVRGAGYSTEFTVGAGGGGGERRFRQLASISNRDATGAQTRIYGALACDLNRDGWCDLTTINEVSSDVRVFLNRADGSGLFQPMLTPYLPIPEESSPNEAADFNADGLVDIVTSSNLASEVAVAFGLGNGQFSSPTLIATAGFPRQIGVLDCDGDGDFDFIVATRDGNTVQRFLNNGAGVFGTPQNFDAGGNGEYGLAVAEFNGDGILDAAVGCVFSQTIGILRGNGNGTFTLASSRPIGGSNWVLQTGDVNGDGRADVSTANSFSNNGTILLGNGNGTLQAATVTPTGGHTVSTDLADIDGDGDLDWVLSSFGAGLWYVYLNNGAGAFTPYQQVVAPANPSCAIPTDVDNDGDIDLVLTDEIADVLVILRNGCPADFDNNGRVDPDDLADYIATFFSTPPGPGADFDNSGAVNPDDLADFIAAFFSGCNT